MLFRPLQYRKIKLTIFSMFGLGILNSAQAETPEDGQYKPSSAQACASLDSNAHRLLCYDSLFGAKAPADPVSIRQHTIVMNNVPSGNDFDIDEPKIEKLGELFEIDSPRFDHNTSLLDKRWELSEDSKLGTWNIRAYQPVYLLPAFWTSNKNEHPHSPNPHNHGAKASDQHLDSTETKFQLSLKTKAWENIFGDNGDLWIGYTQSSRWQTYNADQSRPFRETNYEPEVSLMFRTNYDVMGLNGRLLGLTLNHQSNGRSNPLSRSWNRVILNLGFEKDNFAMMLRPWYRIEDNSAKADNNPDISDYIGRGDLMTFYRWKDNDFSLMLRHSLKGGEDSHSAAQFDWSFPIKGRLRGHFQIFDGYGESLIDYNHRATYVGLGVSLMELY